MVLSPCCDRLWAQWVVLPGMPPTGPWGSPRNGAQFPWCNVTAGPRPCYLPASMRWRGAWPGRRCLAPWGSPRGSPAGSPAAGPAVEGPEDGGRGRLLLEGKAHGPIQPASRRPSPAGLPQLVDGIPMRLETLIRLAVPGRSGKSSRAGCSLKGRHPSISSAMPARVEAGGQLRAQLLPGDRTVRVEARLLAPAASRGMDAWTASGRKKRSGPSRRAATSVWWSFRRPADRPVPDRSPGGLEVPAGLPPGAGGHFAHVEKQRGDPSPQAGTLTFPAVCGWTSPGRASPRRMRSTAGSSGGRAWRCGRAPTGPRGARRTAPS